MPMGGVALGGGIGTVALVLIALFFGIDPSVVLQGGDPTGGPPAVQQPQRAPSAGDDQLKDFVSVVLGDTEDTWKAIFQRMNRQYREPTLVLFSGGVRSACGMGQTAMGPFYCPGDHKLYIDLSFYRDLRDRLGAPGDFAQAYVIAHEVGHHVQRLLGVEPRVREAQGRDPARRNALSVRLELQADCLAGVWGASARRRGLLDPGEVEEGLRAAAAVGDDRLQRRGGGEVSPESFTHGTAEQRSTWFRRGLEAGELEACDTFAGAE
jgi:hypothetical protein